MKARLSTGEVIELEQDCDCVIHEGPHWLHMDSVDKSLNRPLYERAIRGERLAAYAFARQEQRRLSTKLREMESRNIVEILI